MFNPFRNYVLRKQVEAEQLRFDLRSTQALSKMVTRMDAARFADPDPDENDWKLIGQSGGKAGGQEAAGIALMVLDHYRMLENAMNAWQWDLFARAIVRNLSKFVFGQGPMVKAVSKNKAVQDAWDSFVKYNAWNLKEKEVARRVFRDGELFIRKFVNGETGDLAVRFLRANNIKNPSDIIEGTITGTEHISYGIGTSTDDIEIPINYYYVDGMGTLLQTIPASQIIHIKALVDSDMKRGMSFLLIALKKLKQYDEWLEDRIVLNKIRTAIALVRKVDGPTTNIDALRSNRLTETKRGSDYDNRTKMFGRGTVLTATKNINYEMLSPNIQATDVKDDGRAILMAIAAGMGFPEMILTADYSNANYASTMVAQNPFVREIEDWQDFFKQYYQRLFGDVVRAKKEFGNIPQDESEDCEIEFPPMITANILQNNQARAIQRQNKVLSQKTWMQKEGLDPEVEEENMKNEMEKDVYKEPFQMPTAPTNQFGSYNEDED